LKLEDEESMRKMTGALSERLGFKVELVENEEKAIARYQSGKQKGRPFDVILIIMPRQWRDTSRSVSPT
jgi:CheY-like chemotaxis protein